MADETQRIYCSTNHPLATQAEQEPDLLLNQYAWVKRGYNLEQDVVPIKPKNLTATAKQMETTLLFIMAGTHVGYLPTDYAHPHVKNGSITPIFSNFSYSVPHYLMTKNPNAPLIKAFIEIFNLLSEN